MQPQRAAVGIEIVHPQNKSSLVGVEVEARAGTVQMIEIDERMDTNDDSWIK